MATYALVFGCCVHQPKLFSAAERIYDFLNQYGYVNGGIVDCEGATAPTDGGMSHHHAIP